MQVTANRELDREASETENALRALKDQSQRDMLLLRQTRDGLVAANADLRAATDADRGRAEELDAALRETFIAASFFEKPSSPTPTFVCLLASVNPRAPCSAILFWALMYAARRDLIFHLGGRNPCVL